MSRSRASTNWLQHPVRGTAGYDQSDQGIGLLLFVALFFAVLYEDALLTVLLGVALATVAVAGYYKRFAGRGLDLTVKVQPRRIFPEQTARLEVSLRNSARLPLPWLNVLVHLPRRMEVSDLKVQRSPIEAVLTLPFSLGGRQALARRAAVHLSHRGLYKLGPVDALVSDPFGIQETLREGNETSTLLVYPRIRPLSAQLRRSLPIGDRRGHSFLDEETHYLGPRAYQPTDPLRRIDWRQSARRGDLYVKTFETVATAATALFLDPTTARDPWDGIDTEVLEETVEITASLASDLIGRGDAVGLYVSGVFSAVAGRRAFSYRERPRTGQKQLSRMLEALAQVRPPGIFRDLPRIIVEEVPRLPYHVHVVVITPYLTHELQRALMRSARNHSTYFLATGQADPARDATLPPTVRPLRVFPR
ncbi:MAG: DUF58 domain-containing protein [Thermaerobacter sp.]|nr:DUF58 domain-containing protein [Thermaerobacter sp.]